METKKTKLILLKRIRPVVYEVHINKIEQSKNILFTTTDEGIAKRTVDAFNKIEKLKKKLATAENNLGVKEIFIKELGKAYQRNIAKIKKKNNIK